MSVPTHCWKIVVILNQGRNDLERINTQTRVIAVIMPNDLTLISGWRNYRVTVNEIEELTDMTFYLRFLIQLRNSLSLNWILNSPMTDIIHEYLVVDELYPDIGLDANVYFATNDLKEAKLVANEVWFNCMVVRYDFVTGDDELVYDAAFNTELALEP